MFTFLCFWGFTHHLNLQLQLHVETDVEPNVRTSSKRVTEMSHAFFVNKGFLPFWKQSLHLSADVALTGAFRYYDTVQCENVCELFLPAIDLKAVIIERDDAVELSHNRQVIQNVRIDTSRKAKNVPLFNKRQVTHETDNRSSYTKNLVKLFSHHHHALLTRGGNKAFGPNGVKANQDRAFIMYPFSFRENFSKHDLLMGLFDGHGPDGHVVSHYITLQLPQVLTQMLEQTHSPSDALTQTFLNLEENLPPVESSGSTAIVMLRWNDTLYVANTGDSLAFVASFDDGGNVMIIYQTKPHKPHLPEERARIETAGGQVMAPQSPEDSSRVIVFQEGGMVMALAMSRSIGDKEGTVIGVIAEPTVDALELKTMAPSHKKLFAVAASDGLFDHIPPHEVATELAKSLFGSSPLSPLEACEQLIMKSSKGWIATGMPYRDDITVATTILNRD
jgi:serine/threonine protein phosphatase PrpC